MQHMIHKAGWAVSGVLALLVVAALSGVIDAGRLDPPGAPAPTGKTLEDVDTSWDRKLPSDDGAPGPNPPAGCNSTRFVCGDLGVLDRETGLLWLQDADFFVSARQWIGAFTGCLTLQVNGRRGWRLPTFEELTSLVDPAQAPTLPPGHPFANLQTDLYWTDLSPASQSAYAYGFDGTTLVESKAVFNEVWCVRGGPSYNYAPTS